MTTVSQSLKSRAHVIAMRTARMPIGDALEACAVSYRMLARAAQLEGDAEAWASHAHIASKYAHMAELRARGH